MGACNAQKRSESLNVIHVTADKNFIKINLSLNRRNIALDSVNLHECTKDEDGGNTINYVML